MKLNYDNLTNDVILLHNRIYYPCTASQSLMDDWMDWLQNCRIQTPIQIFRHIFLIRVVQVKLKVIRMLSAVLIHQAGAVHFTILFFRQWTMRILSGQRLYLKNISR